MNRHIIYLILRLLVAILIINLFPNNLLANNKKKGYIYHIGGHQVYIQPIVKYYTGSGQREWKSIDTDGNPISKNLYVMTFNNDRLYLLDNELIMNGYSYGYIDKDDKIKIIDRVVHINNKETEGRLLSKEFRVSLSFDKYFSSAKLGTHTVFVAPGLNITTTDIENIMGINVYNYIVGETHVSISNDTLTVNDKGYGLIKESSIIVVEEGEVFINDEAKIKEIDTGIITDL